MLRLRVSEEWAIKLSEKESAIKSFILFFLVIELFLIFIFYHYSQIQQKYLKESLYLEMKNYSFFFEGDRFDIDIVPKKNGSRFYELLEDQEYLYILVPLPTSKEDLLKIMYPIESYQAQLSDIWYSILWQFILLSVVSILISILFSLYVLKPLRQSLRFIEIFTKDIIHDLNTPLSSIMINLKMMDQKNEEVQSIAQSTKAIAMLHKNLENTLREVQVKSERFDVKGLVEEQIRLFRPLYNHLEWSVQLEPLTLKSDPDSFSRIIYNLLSNACKHNVSNGTVSIFLDGTMLSISNSSYGIQNPSRIFERFYKEQERGLGIGLHIVDKLSKELGIKTEVQLKGTTVTFSMQLDRVVY